MAKAEKFLDAVDQGLGQADAGAATALLGSKDPVYKPKQQTIDHYDAVKKLKGVEINEVFSTIEAASALLGHEIEMANKYRVMHQDRLVYFGLEETKCCARQCQRGCLCWAPAWDVSLRAVTALGEAEDSFHLEKPSGCTCCCWGRPQVFVKDVRADKRIATVTEPCTCTSFRFEIQDENEEPQIELVGGGCQWGLCCPLPCGPCSEVHFEVKKGDKLLGTVTKKVPNCCTWLFASDVDNYKVEFPDIEDPKMKIALMAAIIFVDFRFFNNNSNDDMRKPTSNE